MVHSYTKLRLKKLSRDTRSTDHALAHQSNEFIKCDTLSTSICIVVQGPNGTRPRLLVEDRWSARAEALATSSSERESSTRGS